MKAFLRQHLPPAAWHFLERAKKGVERPWVALVRRLARLFGYNIARKKDYYSPLPADLKKHALRWNKPSALVGVRYDLEAFKGRLAQMMAAYYGEFTQLPPYAEITRQGFGPGYTELDALTLYLMLRQHKPGRYLEVGSGVSTVYASLAAAQNERDGRNLQLQCIEPYPYGRLHSLANIRVLAQEVQDTDPALFQTLAAGDVLFIDSSHMLKIDSDVAFLFLEVLPRLQAGVLIHIHDIPFPYNIPYPADYWVLGRSWPMYWNEAMVLQAFLAFNEHFEILLSTPLLRHFDEPFLQQNIPFYKPVAAEPNTFSSIWLRKTA